MNKNLIDNISYVSFVNLIGVRNFFRYIHVYSVLNEFNKNREIDFIFVYSTHLPFLKAASHYKKIKKNAKIILIVPDLPQYTNLNDNICFIYKFFKQKDIKKIMKLQDFVDGYVYFSKNMEQHFLQNGISKPNTVIEGIIDYSFSCVDINSVKLNSEFKKVLYTGNLHYKFGIKELIDSMIYIERNDFELYICGAGEAEEYIIEKSRLDPRIKFLGQVSNSEALRLQMNANILINPRNDSNAYTIYSFPSKTLEYLITGNIVLAYKLGGIPNEYDKYIYYIQKHGAQGIAETLNIALNMEPTYMKKFGESAKNYVIDQKGIAATSKKIMSLLEEVSLRYDGE
jgi:glycosyltransferase involved in cell wall biosynthesis